MSLISSKVQSRKDWETMLQNHEWVPFDKVKPTDFGYDWVLVQFVEKSSGFVGIPYIGEYFKLPTNGYYTTITQTLNTM